MPTPKPAGKSFRVTATELNFSGGAPTLGPLTWANNGGTAIVQTPEPDGLACVFACSDPARGTPINITVTATAANGKIGSIVLNFTADPSVIASVTLAVDPSYDP